MNAVFEARNRLTSPLGALRVASFRGYPGDLHYWPKLTEASIRVMRGYCQHRPRRLDRKVYFTCHDLRLPLQNLGGDFLGYAGFFRFLGSLRHRVAWAALRRVFQVDRFEAGTGRQAVLRNAGADLLLRRVHWVGVIGGGPKSDPRRQAKFATRAGSLAKALARHRQAQFRQNASLV